MKVRCINSGQWYANGTRRTDGPQTGEVYTVVGEIVNGGIKYYHLEEYPPYESGVHPAFESTSFSPIEGANVEELIKELEGFKELENA